MGILLIWTRERPREAPGRGIVQLGTIGEEPDVVQEVFRTTLHADRREAMTEAAEYVNKNGGEGLSFATVETEDMVTVAGVSY